MSFFSDIIAGTPVIRDQVRNMSRSMNERLATSLGLLLMFCTPALAATASVAGCGDLANGYGPYDYTNGAHFRQKLPIVEQAHFTMPVQTLQRGATATMPGGDIDYTLRAFPNHHRALYAMSAYALRYRGQFVPPGARYSAECYFDRAMRFKPDDGVVRMLYGIHQYKLGKLDKALMQYDAALQIMPDSAELHNNLGLLYVARGDYVKANEHANKAYSLGFPLPGLRNRLIELDAWEMLPDDSP